MSEDLQSKHDTKSIQEFLDMHSHRRLNLEPGFQRRSVWSITDRRLLVQSLAEGIPLPAIYLYEQKAKHGSLKYDVIDGKQRLETILWFMRKGPLANEYDDDLWVRLQGASKHADPGALEWTNWPACSTDFKAAFLRSRIPVIEVTGDLAQITQLFVRINSTGRRLDGQERRHAQFFTSPLLKTAQKAADRFAPYFLKRGVLTEAQIQRMRHVELTTELILFGALKDHPNKKSKIDQVIAGEVVSVASANHEIVQLNADFKILDQVLPDLKSTRFRRTTDFYSLVTLIRAMRTEGLAVNAHTSARNRLAGDLLREFGREVDLLDEKSRHLQTSTGDSGVQQYLLSVRADTDSSKTRKAREALLREVLVGVFEPVDPKRLFNPTQRRIIWHSSAHKQCSLCGKRITRWEDLSVDHVKPYVVGGATDLKNAALTHKACNSKKGAKTL